MGLEYYWRQIAKAWNFRFLGRRVSFGFWLNIAVDRVLEEKRSKVCMDEDKKVYRYHPLQSQHHIRVLELFPGRPEDPLRGRIIDNSALWDCLDDYEALSYCWGAVVSRNEMPRIGLDEEYLPIQPNLEAALRQLRFLNTSRRLWVDSLCINQEDDEEKKTQVQIMQDIYAQAQTVNIWLGEARGNSSMGMEVLSYLAKTSMMSKEPPPWAKVPDARFLDGFKEVLQRDWFERMWVVQEAAVSRRAVMICGEDSFEWTNDPLRVWKFIRRIKYAAISPQWEQSGLSNVNIGIFLQVLNLQMQHIKRGAMLDEHMGSTFPADPLQTDIVDVAFEIRHRKATDKRDRLFAVMGLVARSYPYFKADYGMNVEEVYQRLLDSIEI